MSGGVGLGDLQAEALAPRWCSSSEWALLCMVGAVLSLDGFFLIQIKGEFGATI